MEQGCQANDSLPSAEGDHYLRRELYQRIKDGPEIFEFIQSGSLDGIWYWDLDDQEQEWLSPRFKALFGYRDDEVPNTSDWWKEHIFEEDLPAVLENFGKHLEDPDHPYDQVVRYRHRDGSTVWVRCRGLAIRDEQGRPIRLLGAHQDITELMETKQALAVRNAELEATVIRDSLTGLLNRQGILERLDEAVHRARRGRDLAVLFIDLTNFKEVNDTYGHLIGDSVLCAAAGRLDDTIRGSDHVGRLGGDEFLVVLDGVPSATQAHQVAERCLAALMAPLRLPGIQAEEIRCCIGIATFRPADTAETLMKEADAAMYRAKHSESFIHES
ncbi:MAG: sensor domain-containing diguanylate cyclase [Actinomycetia bacterium]|nr:sensor domain-containing diguanylate cyclase [Actinomycetes bacterium]MCH9700892.1 sensor domain-containing diguanylate cyclase [Actinomycetes bacterium]MCH9760846.1 sensor domain-containing diguanylate cyclase [Actinomycetes bacterium]